MLPTAGRAQNRTTRAPSAHTSDQPPRRTHQTCRCACARGDPRERRVVQRATHSPHGLVSSTTRYVAHGTQCHAGTTRAEHKEGGMVYPELCPRRTHKMTRAPVTQAEFVTVVPLAQSIYLAEKVSGNTRRKLVLCCSAPCTALPFSSFAPSSPLGAVR
ncbi:hypothetical protein C8J57DRAFT_1304582 [Mycena rebaudengoi]|nr:hypothetical protein C8J57DRAFT_1304582 [Mycena rebaudengoi]